MLDAASVMTRFVVTASPDSSIADIAKLLAQHAISGLPVCDKDGTLLGVISEGDLVRQLTKTVGQRRTWWLEMLSEGDDLAPEFVEYLRLDNRRAQDLMHKTAITATEGTSVADIAEIMNQNNIKRVPIVKDGKLVGIVTRADLIRALARTRDAFT